MLAELAELIQVVPFWMQVVIVGIFAGAIALIVLTILWSVISKDKGDDETVREWRDWLFGKRSDK